MSRFQDAVADMRRKRQQAAEKVGHFLEAEAKLRVSVKTGETRRSISHATQHDENTSTVKVGSNLEHVPSLEEGSRPHEIKSKDGKPLKLKIDGIWVTVGKVHHPGTKPQPFLQPSIDENIAELQEMIRRELDVND